MHRQETRKKWNYRVVSEFGFCEELGRFETYGIEVTGQCLQKTVHDVSVNREVADGLSALFNRYQLSPTHMMDVIADQLP